METKIPPALTAAEWEYVKAGGDPLYRTLRMIEGGDRLSKARRHPDELTRDDAAVAHAAVALANDALPEGDERKLTHADVAEIREAARVIDAEFGPRDAQAARLVRVAEKLAAWLQEKPPHG